MHVLVAHIEKKSNGAHVYLMDVDDIFLNISIVTLYVEKTFLRLSNRIHLMIQCFYTLQEISFYRTIPVMQSSEYNTFEISSISL